MIRCLILLIFFMLGSKVFAGEYVTLGPLTKDSTLNIFLNSYLAVRDVSIDSNARVSERTLSGSSCRGHCEDFYMLCGPDDGPIYHTDLFGNPISIYGKYGSNPR